MQRVTHAVLVSMLATGCVASHAANDGPPTGTWSGYVEAYAFRSGSDQITLLLDEATPGGAIRGHVYFGDGTDPGTPTDPDLGWPEDLRTATSSTSFSSYADPPYEGFGFTMLDGTWVGDRIRFGVDTRELWGAWCEIQTSIPDAASPGIYACVPNVGFGSDGTSCSLGTGEPVDCMKLAMCLPASGPCTCDATGCTGASFGANVSFDIAIEATGLEGTVTGLARSGATVRLTRSSRRDAVPGRRSGVERGRVSQ